MSNPKINSHVFHGIYSNGFYFPFLLEKWGYHPNFFRQLLFDKNTLHFNRAIEGYLGDNSKPIFFNNEDEALEWYKNQFQSPDFDITKVCRNYLKFDEKDFHKYKDLFHSMIKGLKIDTEINVKIKGKDRGTTTSTDPDQLWEFEETISSANATISRTFTNPGVEGYYQILGFSNGAITVNGKDPEPIDKQKPSKSVTIVTSGEVISPSSPGGVGLNTTEQTYIKGSINVIWYSAYNPIDSEGKSKIDIDSSKIFDIKELENRLGGNLVNYRATFYAEPSPGPESREVWERLYRNDFQNFGERPSTKGIFFGNWEFNKEEFEKLFKNSTSNANTKKFTLNTTLINDPVVIQDSFGDTQTGNRIRYGLLVRGQIFGAREDQDKIKSFSKSTSRFGGGIDLTLLNSSTSDFINNNNYNTIQSILSEAVFRITAFMFIRSEKKYLCFVEFDSIFTFNGGDSNGFRLTTDDFFINQIWNPEFEETECQQLLTTKNTSSREKINVKILKQNLEFEVWQTNKSFSKKYNKCSESDDIFNLYVDLNTEYEIKNSIEVIPWEKDDFDSKNTFLPKIP